MKVRDFVKFLMDFDMDADIVVSTGDTFDDYEEMDLSWGGGYKFGDCSDKSSAEFIFINNLLKNNKESLIIDRN